MTRPRLLVERKGNNAVPGAALPVLLATGCGVVAADLSHLKPLATLGLETRFRARANGSFMAAYSAAGAAFGGWIDATHGWAWACLSGIAEAAAAMPLFAARSRAGHPVST